MAYDDKSVYYDAGGIETFDIMKAKLSPVQWQGYLTGNILKYLCRANFKHTVKESLWGKLLIRLGWKRLALAMSPRDVEKASFYMSKLVETIK